MTGGVYLYTGIRQSGKTTLALKYISMSVRATGAPVLVIDSTAADNFRGEPHAGSVAAAVRTVWGDRRHAWVIPAAGRLAPGASALDEVRVLMRCARQLGRAVVLLDECAFWLRAQYVPEEIAEPLRVPSHARLEIHLTTQYLGDIHPMIYQCATKVYVMRQEAEGALERCRRWWGLPAERLRALGRGEFVTVQTGF